LTASEFAFLALGLVLGVAAGVPADDPALRRAGEWLLREEVRVRGDWALRRPPTGMVLATAHDAATARRLQSALRTLLRK